MSGESGQRSGAAVEAHPPADPSGDWLDQEWDTEIDLLGLHAKPVLGRGLDLLVDPGMLLTTSKLDRLLRRIRRTRKDPRVVLLRLSISTPEAVRRKTTLRPAYVRASHRGWVTRPIRGEVHIEATGKTARQVLREASEELALRAGRPPAVRKGAHRPTARRRRSAALYGDRGRRALRTARFASEGPLRAQLGREALEPPNDPLERTPLRGNAYR